MKKDENINNTVWIIYIYLKILSKILLVWALCLHYNLNNIRSLLVLKI